MQGSDGRASPGGPFALLLVLGTLWGLTPAVGKLAVGGGIGPIGYALLYAAASAAILAGLVRARSERPILSARAIGFYALNGLIAFALPGTLTFVTLQHLPAGVLAMVIPAAPLITLLLAAATGVERVSPQRAAGVVLALAGTALALAPGAVLPDPDALGWAALSLLVPTFYAVSNVFAARFRPPGAP
ncbi:MAG: EamA family transporter, partial [Acetobacteraceae bacterium]